MAVPPDLRYPAHIGVATRDIDEAIQRLTPQWGTTWETPRFRELQLWTPEGTVDWTFRVAHSSGPMGMELLEGSPGSIWASDESTHLHHYAYWSDNFPNEVEALRANGWTLEITSPNEEGLPSVFAYFRKPGGLRVELIAR